MRNTLIILLLFISLASAQQNKLTGNLSADANIAFKEGKQVEPASAVTGNKKSPLLAGILSAAVPGAGQFYTENYWYSALYVAIEVAGITAAIVYDGKGDDQTAFFENYANENYSAAQYARWTLNHLDELDRLDGNPGELDPADYSGLFYDAEMTQVNWKVLNEMEGDIGSYYSHRLERFGHQQYYEMIGKYQQFAPGWEDFGDENTPYTYGDPVSPMFTHYSGLRGEANDYYSNAKTAVIIVVSNHVISALHAAWQAHSANKLQMRMSLGRENIGFTKIYYPQLNLKYTF